MNMTEKEALEFLELPESATKSQIKIRLVEKLEYFEDLSKNAPSDFLRRIHARNIDKVKKIQQEFFPWSSLESGSEVILPLDKEANAPEEEVLHTVPIILTPGSKMPPPTPKKEGPPAWLVLHTEGKPLTAFALQKGNNYIGRKVQGELNPFIVIEGDPFISRVHAVVNVEGNDDAPACFLLDSAEANSGQCSRNGSYINGDHSRIQKAPIKENDTIQVGVTKMVLRYNTKELRSILEEVSKTEHAPTVSVG